MLQEFLSNSFITLTDDANLSKLKKSSDDVAKKLLKSKLKIIPYTLAALDPEVSADNEDIIEVSDIITKHWPTFKGNAKDTPLTYVRAVMLQALESISSDLNISSLIWSSARNVVVRYNLGKQKPLLIKFVEDLGNKIEIDAMTRWSLPEASKQDRTTLDLNKLTGDAIDKSDLDKNLKDIRIAVNKLLSESQIEVEQRRILQLRSHLLWWKESNYSPTLKKSYHGLTNGVLQIVLAMDYATFIPSIYPASVDYFLKETNAGISLGTEKRVKISELVKLADQAVELKEVFAGYVEERGRISLLSFLKGTVAGVYNPKQFKNLVGLKDSEEVSTNELVAWLFHDFHAQKLSK